MESTTDTQMPISGYDGLKTHRLVADLSKHSQIELAAIDAYESAHEARPEVLNKLRYLRGSEPISGYDDLTPEAISAALQDADLQTITDAREYERKFHRRPPVLEDLNRLRRQRASAHGG